jgi:hypothetical protein
VCVRAPPTRCKLQPVAAPLAQARGRCWRAAGRGHHHHDGRRTTTYLFRVSLSLTHLPRHHRLAALFRPPPAASVLWAAPRLLCRAAVPPGCAVASLLPVPRDLQLFEPAVATDTCEAAMPLTTPAKAAQPLAWVTSAPRAGRSVSRWCAVVVTRECARARKRRVQRNVPACAVAAALRAARRRCRARPSSSVLRPVRVASVCAAGCALLAAREALC